MKTFESKIVSINCAADKIFQYLHDFRNFESILPEEVSKWSCDETHCSFTISNMADLNMVFGACINPRQIEMKSEGKNPFDYQLITEIVTIEDSKSEVKVIFHADLNPMLAMMASNPLKNFVNTLAVKLKEILES